MLVQPVSANGERCAELLEEFPEGGSYVDKFARLQQHFAVIKVGGAIIDSPELLQTTAVDLVNLQSLGLSPIVVHGGGQQIDRELAKRGQQTEKVSGRRITRQEHMPAVASALSVVNSVLCETIVAAGGEAAGVSDVFTGTLQDPDDLGSSDEITNVDSSEIEQAALAGALPVVSCIGHLAVSGPRQMININADASSGALASHLKVLKHISLTKDGAITDGTKTIDNITASDARELITQGVIHGGMIPKVNEALRLLDNGVHDVVITSPSDLMKELFTDEGAGTIIHVDDSRSGL